MVSKLVKILAASSIAVIGIGSFLILKNKNNSDNSSKIVNNLESFNRDDGTKPAKDVSDDLKGSPIIRNSGSSSNESSNETNKYSNIDKNGDVAGVIENDDEKITVRDDDGKISEIYLDGDGQTHDRTTESKGTFKNSKK